MKMIPVFNKNRYLRKLLTESSDPDLDQLHDSDILKILTDNVESIESAPDVLVESLWILAYLAGGDRVLAQGILPLSPRLIGLLSGSSGWHVSEMAAWVLGNLAADGSYFTDRLLSDNALLPLTHQMFRIESAVAEGDRDQSASCLTAVWVLSSLVRNGNNAACQILSLPDAPQKIVRLLYVKHPNVISEISWLVTYMLAKDNKSLEDLYSAGIVQPLVEISRISLAELNGDISSVRSVLIPVLRSIGNIAAGINPFQMQQMLQIDSGSIIKSLFEYLSYNHRGIQKEAAWALSNIAGCPDRLGADSILNFKNSIPVLSAIFQNSGFEIKKEIGFLIANLCSGADFLNIEFLTKIAQDIRVTKTYMQLIQSPDMEAVHLGLSFFQTVLENLKNGREAVDSSNAIEVIENIQYRNYPKDIQQTASQLIDFFYGDDLEEI